MTDPSTQPAIQSAVTELLGEPVRALEPVRGGDICRSFKATLADGRDLFVKTHVDGAAMFTAEAEGLRWLAAADALAIAEVVAVGTGEPALLVLEFIAESTPAPDYDERLGRGLARLHRAGAPSFGAANDNFIGSLPQRNTPSHAWSEFYWTRRLAPLLDRALAKGLLQARDRAEFERLATELPRLVGAPEPPARLHGDLWSGNAIADARGCPVLVDPAVYGGHREVDLAMMRLFGGFSRRCFAAYEEEWPLQPGSAEREPLYQLYPLLVHVNLFGRGYVGQLRSALRLALPG